MTVDRSADESRAGAAGVQDRWFLADERDFLLRSLNDADLEHAAGDLSDEDFTVLAARDRARLAEVEAELAAVAPAEPVPTVKAADAGVAENASETTRPPMVWWRKVGIVVSCLFILVGAGLLVSHFIQPAQPGQPVTGTVSVGQEQLIEQQDAEALQDNSAGETGTALNLYDKVLSEDPSDPAALGQGGFLEWNLGTQNHVADLVKIGTAEIAKAVKVAPDFYLWHLFEGEVLADQDHDAAAAVIQFNKYLADGPPAGEAPKVAADAAPAYKALGQPLPAGFTSSSSSSSTSTSAP
jgi:hypothetical protein